MRNNITFNDDLNEVSMKIILESGNARNTSIEAVKLASMGLFEEAFSKIEDASRMIGDAHRSQTDIVQSSASEDAKVELSLLFIHALDTLMTVKSEVNLRKELINVYQILL